MLRRNNAQRPGEHPRPEGAGGDEDLAVHVGRHLPGELDLDLSRPRQVHRSVATAGPGGGPKERLGPSGHAASEAAVIRSIAMPSRMKWMSE